MKRYALAMQLDMLRQRQHVNEQSLALAGRKNMYGNSSGRACVVWNDRSLWGDAVFAALNHKLGNMDRDDYEIYLSVLKAGGPYQYDSIVFFDVEASRAHFLNQEHRKDPAEHGIPLSYFEQGRLSYFMQIRQQALSGRASIIYIYNDPWVEVSHVLDKLLVQPSTDKVREIFEAAPELHDNATEAEVSAAFRPIREAYDAYYKEALQTLPVLA